MRLIKTLVEKIRSRMDKQEEKPIVVAKASIQNEWVSAYDGLIEELLDILDQVQRTYLNNTGEIDSGNWEGSGLDGRRRYLHLMWPTDIDDEPWHGISIIVDIGPHEIRRAKAYSGISVKVLGKYYDSPWSSTLQNMDEVYPACLQASSIPLRYSSEKKMPKKQFQELYKGNDQEIDLPELLRLYEEGERNFIRMKITPQKPPPGTIEGFGIWDYKTPLENANLTGIDLTKVKFDHLSMENINLADSVLKGCFFWGGLLRGANLSAANLTYSRFIGADLSDSILDEANLYQASFLDTDFRGASMKGANLQGAELDMCHITMEQLSTTLGVQQDHPDFQRGFCWKK